MKRGMLIGLILGIALMAVLVAIPALAHGPSTDTSSKDTTVTQQSEDIWEKWAATQHNHPS